MRLKPDTFGLTIALGLLTALGPLATDMYLPSLPAITAQFGSTVSRTQLTLSLFMAGFAGGQLIYGPISDRLGRRGVLLVAIGLVLAADIACALAPGMNTLIVARLAQGIATAGPIVLARSIVRDLYEGRRAGQELSRMGSIMGFVPSIAPFIGGLIHEAAGWRMTFGVQALLALGLAVMVVSALPETIGVRRRTDPLTFATFPQTYGGLLAHATFRLYSALACAIFCGLFAFISTSSYVLQLAYGQSELAFAASFGVCSAAYVAGTLAGIRLVGRHDIARTMRIGALLMVAGGGSMLVLTVLSGRHAAEIVIPMMIFMLGLGMAFPQTIAGAMSPFPDRAGAASSLFGFLQMTSGAVIGLIAAWAFDGSGAPLATIIFTSACVTLVLSRRIAR